MLSAEWRRHVLAVRGLALAAIGLHAVLLLAIPSEVGTLRGDIVRQPRRELSILSAALPATLAIGVPFGAVVLLRLPLRLSCHPPSLSRGLAMGMLCVASMLSIATVLALRGCPGVTRSAPCMRAPFNGCRYPMSLGIVLLATALSILLPSLPGLVGTAWLALHLDRQHSAEEAVLAGHLGAEWAAYAAYTAEVPRWPGVYAGVCLLLACALVGWVFERCLHARDSRAKVVDRTRSVEDPESRPVCLPVGIPLVIFVASQAQRVAYLPDQRTLFVCGVPQDLRAALLLSCCCLLGCRSLRRLLCVVALLILGVDLFLRLNAGVRLNLDLVVYGVGKSFHPALLLSNLAMAPAGTLTSACVMVPIALLLVRAADRLRVWSTRPRLVAIIVAASIALVVESPCCGASQSISLGVCSATPPGRCCEAKARAQSSNVLCILAAVCPPRISLRHGPPALRRGALFPCAGRVGARIGRRRCWPGRGSCVGRAARAECCRARA